MIADTLNLAQRDFFMNFFSKHLSLSKATVTFLGVLGFSAPVFADVAARVTFVTGQVSVIDSNNNKRSVFKGDLIRGGEKIETANGRIQVRMTDGGIIVLRPNSIFEITRYSFSKDTPELGTVLFNFIKGGARAISGAIGKANRVSYQFKTPVATIGIRGTDYSSALADDGTLTVTVTDGQVNIANSVSESDANEGESYLVANGNSPALCHNTNAVSKKAVTETCEPVIIPLETEDGVYFSKEKIKKPLLENFSNYGAYAEAMRQYKLLESEYILAGGQTEKDDSFTIGLIEKKTNKPKNTGPFENNTETLDINEMRNASVFITKYSGDVPHNYVLNTKSLDASEMRDSSIVSAIGIQPDSPPSLLQIIELKELLQKRVFSFKLSDSLLDNNPNLFNDDDTQNDVQALLERLFNINTRNFLGNNASIVGADFGEPDIDVILGNNAFEGITVKLGPNPRNKDYLVGRGVLSPEVLAQLDANNNNVYRGFAFRQGLIHDNDGIKSNKNSGSLVLGNGSLEESTVVFTDDSTPISVNLSLGRGVQTNTLDQTALSVNVNTPKIVIKLGDIYVSNSDSSAANINKDGSADLGALAVLGSSNDGGPDIKIMGPSEIVLGAATINAKLQHHTQTINRTIDGINVIPNVTILADAFIRDGLAINHVDIKDVAGSIQGGSLMIDSVKITDYASPNLTAKLEVNIEESGKGKNATVGGLLLTLKQLGDAINGIDIAMNNLRVGTRDTPDIGDVQIIGLDLNGSHIVIRGH